MNVDDITILHGYTLLPNELIFDSRDHLRLELADGRLVIVESARLKELLVEFLTEPGLGCVVINSHQLQIEQLLIDDVLVEGQADRERVRKHHEATDGDSGQAPVVLRREHLFRLLALHLRKEDGVEVNGRLTHGEVIVVEVRSAFRLARTLLHEETIEFMLLEVYHLVVLVFERILIGVNVALADSIVVASEGLIKHHARGEDAGDLSRLLTIGDHFEAALVRVIEGHPCAN